MYFNPTKAQFSARVVPFQAKRTPDLICFSHLRWDFVYQRPQHLLNRAAKCARVFFYEEPIFYDGTPTLEIKPIEKDKHYTVTPKLPHGLSEDAICSYQKVLLDRLMNAFDINDFIGWYYTPMALKFSRHLEPSTCIYDCMDQLSHFKNAPSELEILEIELFERADAVFTGGHSLFEEKRDYHDAVYPFPSSVDVDHFLQARTSRVEPDDQIHITKPRIGYVGVIDERIDLELIDKTAEKNPEWEFVMVGPVVKIDPATLPRRPNIHYLGQKSYTELPTYLGSWNVAIMPFARNDATKYISPTKTPEYLAAGLPVVSTSIRDVVKPYGELGLVTIADDVEAFTSAIERSLVIAQDPNWRRRVDIFLSRLSWDNTFRGMWDIVEEHERNSRKLDNSLFEKSIASPQRAMSDLVYYGGQS